MKHIVFPDPSYLDKSRHPTNKLKLPGTKRFPLFGYGKTFINKKPFLHHAKRANEY